MGNIFRLNEVESPTDFSASEFKNPTFTHHDWSKQYLHITSMRLYQILEVYLGDPSCYWRHTSDTICSRETIPLQHPVAEEFRLPGIQPQTTSNFCTDEFDTPALGPTCAAGLQMEGIHSQLHLGMWASCGHHVGIMWTSAWLLCSPAWALAKTKKSAQLANCFRRIKMHQVISQRQLSLMGNSSTKIVPCSGVTISKGRFNPESQIFCRNPLYHGYVRLNFQVCASISVCACVSVCVCVFFADQCHSSRVLAFGCILQSCLV